MAPPRLGSARIACEPAWTTSDESVALLQAKKLQQYKALRAKDKARMQNSITLSGFAILVVAVAGFAVRSRTPDHLVPAQTFLVYFLIAIGLVMICAADVDWDGMMRRHPRFARTYSMVLAFAFCAGPVGRPPMYGLPLAALPLLYAQFRWQRVNAPGARIRMSDVQLMAAPGLALAFCCRAIEVAVASESVVFAIIVAPLYCGNAALSIFSLLHMRQRGRVHEVKRNRAFWSGILIFDGVHMLANGWHILIMSVMMGDDTEQWNRLTPSSPEQYFYSGIAIMVCGAITTFVWRYKASVFGFIARIFERRTRMADGAVMASLLELEPPVIGDTWWVRDHDSFELGRMQHFHEGVVVQKRGQEDVVVEVRGCNRPASIAERTVVSFPASISDPQALVELCASSLRGVPFDKLDASIMARRSGNNEMYLLSHACQPRQIDWFISHAWDDDAQMKFYALRSEAEAFKARRGRWPILWLDKCCIDQTDPVQILAALKCLPLFLQACNTFYLLAGRSYFTRLWCIWELYVRFALSDGGEKTELVVMELVAPGAANRALSGFELSAATTFDPNQKKQLLDAISRSQGGSAAFQSQVRALSQLLPAPQNTAPQRNPVQNQQYDHGGKPRCSGNPEVPATLLVTDVVKADAPTLTLKQRVEALEISVLGLVSEGGLGPRIRALEQEGLGEEQKGALPARVQALENAGLV